MSERICPVHNRATIDGRCVDCLAEAAEAIVLLTASEGLPSVAEARAWAAETLKPKKAA